MRFSGIGKTDKPGTFSIPARLLSGMKSFLVSEVFFC